MSALDDLASTVVQLMANAATAAATGAGGAAATVVGDLVRTRLAGAGQGDAVAAFDAAPQETAAQGTLHTALMAVLAADQPFVVALTGSLPSAEVPPRPPEPPTYVASGGGVTVQGQGNRVRGNFAGRDQIVNNIRRGDPATLVSLAVVVLLLALAGYGGVKILDDSPAAGATVQSSSPAPDGGRSDPTGGAPSTSQPESEQSTPPVAIESGAITDSRLVGAVIPDRQSMPPGWESDSDAPSTTDGCFGTRNCRGVLSSSQKSFNNGERSVFFVVIAYAGPSYTPAGLKAFLERSAEFESPFPAFGDESVCYVDSNSQVKSIYLRTGTTFLKIVLDSGARGGLPANAELEALARMFVERSRQAQAGQTPDARAL
ncbi:hypothetical protein [Kitasatospora purpeofusca]|uniref:hypothetical protein n=1 Tax=Kitasatospora purpeofusca TaxID=67352 RepID=UPI00382C0B58